MAADRQRLADRVLAAARRRVHMAGWAATRRSARHMKVNVEIDCTPEEARRFLGLPDLRPMQDAVMAKVQQQMLDAVNVLSPESLLKTWMPLAPQSPEQMRDAMAAMFRMFTPGGGAGGKSGPG
ncbi:DUF6489 family protein [Dankookia rubra]